MDEPAAPTVEQRRCWVKVDASARQARSGRHPAHPARPTEHAAAPTVETARKRRPAGSRALHRIGDLTAHAAAGVSAAAAVLIWFGVGLASDFPSWWQTVLYSVSSSITLVMVFAIQHTQSRQQSATQRKLDELLRTHPNADNRLISAEHAPDEELAALASLNLADRKRSASS